MANYALLPRHEEEEEAETKDEMKSSTAAETKHERNSFTAVETKNERKSSTSATAKNVGAPPPAVSTGWTADGLPVGDLTVQRSQWESGIFSCLGKNDEFYSSDLEVCEFFICFILR